MVIRLTNGSPTLTEPSPSRRFSVSSPLYKHFVSVGLLSPVKPIKRSITFEVANSTDIRDEVISAVKRYKKHIKEGIVIQEDLPVIGSRSYIGLYPEVVKMLEVGALRIIIRLFIPTLILYRARNKRRALVASRHATVDKGLLLQVMEQSEIFKLWPTDYIKSLIEFGFTHACQEDEVVFYEDEPPVSFAIIMKGVITVHSPRINGTRTVAATFRAPKIYGEHSVIAEEKHMLVSTPSGCDIWYVKNIDFLTLFNKLPDKCRQEVINSSLAQRKGSMIVEKRKSLTPAHLQKSLLLRFVSPYHASDIIDIFSAEVVPRGTYLCRSGSYGDAMYYLCKGEVAVLITQASGKEIEVARIPSGEFFGEFSIWYNQPQSASIKALGVCELWVLKKSHRSLIAKVTQVDHVDAIAKKKHLALMRHNKVGMIDMLGSLIDKVPVLSELLLKEEKVTLARKFEPLTYIAGEIICSKSHDAEGILVIVSGEARNTLTGKMIPDGTSMGYTCLVQHRWHVTIIAESRVDAWIISRNDLCRYLSSINKYNLVFRLHRLLVQPSISKHLIPSITPSDFSSFLLPPDNTTLIYASLEFKIRQENLLQVAYHPSCEDCNIVYPKFVPNPKKIVVRKPDTIKYCGFRFNSKSTVGIRVSQIKKNCSKAVLPNSESSLPIKENIPVIHIVDKDEQDSIDNEVNQYSDSNSTSLDESLLIDKQQPPSEHSPAVVSLLETEYQKLKNQWNGRSPSRPPHVARCPSIKTPFFGRSVRRPQSKSNFPRDDAYVHTCVGPLSRRYLADADVVVKVNPLSFKYTQASLCKVAYCGNCENPFCALPNCDDISHDGNVYQNLAFPHCAASQSTSEYIDDDIFI